MEITATTNKINKWTTDTDALCERFNVIVDRFVYVCVCVQILEANKKR